MFDTLPRSGWKGTFLTANALIQICLQGNLGHRRIGADVVDIERFVLSACVDLARLTSEMCLGETPLSGAKSSLGRRHVWIRRAATFRGAWAFWCGRLAGGTGPSAAGGGIVLRNWRVCTRGPRGCAASNFCLSTLLTQVPGTSSLVCQSGFR